MEYSSSEYMRSVASAIRNSEDGIIDVPFTPEIDSSNVYAYFHFRKSRICSE